MLKLDFKTLKGNYSTSPTSIHKCTMHFPNTCAIRMSEALIKSNEKMLNLFNTSGRNKCPHGKIRGAQDLASILAKPEVLGSRTRGWKGNASASIPREAKGKTGIICYMNIPGFSGQGHIDLWNKEFPVGSDYWDAETIWLWELS